MIAFAFVGKEGQIDCIPFAGIEFVRKWQDEAVSGVSTLLDADSCHVQHQTLTAIHIATMASGYNNGRHYYLSAESVAGRDALLELLQRNTKVARKRAEAETFFQKVQLKVRRRYESRAAQYFLAGLIISVRISHMKQKYVNNICICQYQSRYPCIELQAKLTIFSSSLAALFRTSP
jgi:RNase P subunit RPR2